MTAHREMILAVVLIMALVLLLTSCVPATYVCFDGFVHKEIAEDVFVTVTDKFTVRENYQKCRTAKN